MKKKVLGDGQEDDDFSDSQEDLKLNDLNTENNSTENLESKNVENDENENKDIDNDESNTVVNSDNDNGNESSGKGDTSALRDKDNGKTEEEEEAEEDDSKEDENWSPGPERRSSTRLRNSGKRPKLTEMPTTSDEEDFESDSEVRYEKKEKDRKRSRKTSAPKPKPSPRQRAKPRRKTEPEPRKRKDSSSEAKVSKKAEDSANKPPKEFASGAFVVLKSDFHAGMTPPIWKIDGKALLQKYTPFEQEGQTLYKNTSTYSGWTSNNRDQYYPATVEFKMQNRKETVVRFMREAIVADDSD